MEEDIENFQLIDGSIMKYGFAVFLLGSTINIPNILFFDSVLFQINLIILSISGLILGLSISVGKTKNTIIIVIFSILFILSYLIDFPIILLANFFQIDVELILRYFSLFFDIALSIGLIGLTISDWLNKSAYEPIRDYSKPVESTVVDHRQSHVASGVFISFSSKQSDLAEALHDFLLEEGFDPWISTRDIKVGEEYSGQIIDAIDNSKFFVLLASPDAVESRHVKAELERAFSSNAFIFPIKLSYIEIPRPWEYYLSTSQWNDVQDKSQKQWMDEIIIAIKDKLIGS